MKLREVEGMVKAQMRLHGLSQNGWQFEFDKATRRFGACSHHAKKISMSRQLCMLNKEDVVRDTILHEIAHALVGKGHGHDKVWQAKCKEIGAQPVRCYSSDDVVVVPPKFEGTCRKCNRKIYQDRRNRIACGICCKKYNNGKFGQEYMFDWSNNKEYKR